MSEKIGMVEAHMMMINGDIPETFYATGKEIWQMYPEWAARHNIKMDEEVVYELH